MVEIAFIIILIMLVIASVVTFGYAYNYKNGLAGQVSTRGMNGKAGTTLNLSCPAGEKISFKNSNPTTTRGAIICSGDSQCDPFFQPGVGQTQHFFNPNTTIDVFGLGSKYSNLQENCEGKNSCSWTIPSANDPGLSSVKCLAGCSGDIEFIGTYDCVPE